MKVVEKAAAKINLGLDTPFRHSNGMPEWNMVMTAVDLADYVSVTDLADPKIEVLSNAGFLPNDHRNLGYQAANLVQQKFGVSHGVRIEIDKHIPVAAGLGGGSSDAAAVLRGLNQLWQLNLNLDELARLGLEVDSDVPFCVFGKTAHVTGYGDHVRPLEPGLKPSWLVLAKPHVSVSTPNILRQIDYDDICHPDIEAILTAVLEDDFDGLTDHMGNALERVSMQRYPDIQQIKDRMLHYGADHAIMSGTGPTVFALFKKETRARRVYNSIRGFCSEAYLVRSL